MKRKIQSHSKTLAIAGLLMLLAGAFLLSSCSREETITGVQPGAGVSEKNEPPSELVFGPWKVVPLPEGALNEATFNVSRLDEYAQPFTLRFRNGDYVGNYAADSAELWLNGVQIASADDFPFADGYIDLMVRLEATNTVQVRVNGSGDQYMKVTVLGTPGSNDAVVEVPGTVDMRPLGDLLPGDLSVLTITGEYPVAVDGSFTAGLIASAGLQLMMVKCVASEDLVYLAYYSPESAEALIIDAESSALSLLLMNPYMMGMRQSDRLLFADAARQTQEFPGLVAAIGEVLESSPCSAMNYEIHPNIYQMSAETMRATFLSMGGAKAAGEKAVFDPPVIVDAPGSYVTFRNPRYVYYGYGIEGAPGVSEVDYMMRRGEFIEIEWGWPPIHISEPEELMVDLGDGDFTIDFARGWDFSEFLNMDDPIGVGTTKNTTQGVVYIIDLFISGFDFGDKFHQLPYHMTITTDQAASMTYAMTRGDYMGLLVEFAELMADNREAIALFLWEDFQNNAMHDFINKAAGILENVSVVLKILGYAEQANEAIPFATDCIFAPNITYTINQTDGILTFGSTNEPPVPAFTITPPAGVVGTEFHFDPSGTTDDHDNIADLLFRWDFEADGIWDTGWDGADTVIHAYTLQGSYTAILEVQDTGGQTNTATHSVNVGGGAGTANHVKVFRNTFPWDSNATINMLIALGFTQGQGPGTYEIFNSSAMYWVELVPGQDMVLITNDQNQLFYNDYAANQVKFTNFVLMGGSIFWGACDEGWSSGSMDSAGIILPGSVENHTFYSWQNYVTDPNLPLVAGLPLVMDHNYASHEGLSNLPDGTTIYCVDDHNRATLIEYNLGGGWVIMSGQPLEHQYDRVYGSPDMEQLLPRIAAYFTGRPMPVAMPKAPANASSAPSHLEARGDHGPDVREQ